jgi:hypothetical protein
MERQFSKKLMLKAKRIFEKRSGRTLNEDEIEALLEKLARFGQLYADIVIEHNKKTK